MIFWAYSLQKRSERGNFNFKNDCKEFIGYQTRLLTVAPKVMFTRDDSQRRFLTQHSVVILEQCCNYSKQCRSNVATLCYAKSESLRIITCNIAFIIKIKTVKVATKLSETQT